MCEFVLIMWIHTCEFLLCWRDSLFLGVITSLCLWSREGGKNAIALVRAMVMSVIIVLGVRVSAFGCYTWLAIMLFDMMVFVAPAAWARAKMRARAQRRSRSTPFFGRIAGARWRVLVIVHGLNTLFLEVIALAIILLVVGLVVPCVLVVASTTIMASIVLMTIIRSVIVAITSVASMVGAIFVASVLLVVWFMATCGRNRSCTLFLWLLLVLGDLLGNVSCLVGCLTLLKEGNHSERVGRYHLVQVSKLVLVRLRLRKEDLFTLLLRRGCAHCSMEVVTLEVAKKLHSTPHELVHWHESGLLCCMKPANQLVANVGEPGNGLEVVPDALVEVFLCTICIVRALFRNDAGPLCQAYVLKALTKRLNSNRPFVLLQIR